MEIVLKTQQTSLIIIIAITNCYNRVRIENNRNAYYRKSIMLILFYIITGNRMRIIIN